MPSPESHSRVLSCQRCGSCCRSNPPALHGPDLDLYLQSWLLREHLVTFRQGEMVYDNVLDKVQPLDQEMVRIRSRPGSTTCIFYDHGHGACRIYTQRLLECRVFACWDPQGIFSVYARDRIQRLDLISPRSALGEIICEHERMCSWARVMEVLPEEGHAPDVHQARELASILNADHGLRQGLRDQAGASDAEMEFILGRDMAAVLSSQGLKVHHEGSGYWFGKKRAESGL
ncbi:MAG: YkgJ family cysteine cluster protein [Desulfovermiculus sp.]